MFVSDMFLYKCWLHINLNLFRNLLIFEIIDPVAFLVSNCSAYFSLKKINFVIIYSCKIITGKIPYNNLPVQKMITKVSFVWTIFFLFRNLRFEPSIASCLLNLNSWIEFLLTILSKIYIFISLNCFKCVKSFLWSSELFLTCHVFWAILTNCI